MQIYVGNLAFTATVDDVRQLFEPYGDVARVNLPEDRETGRPRGFGFVEMPNDTEARAAIAGLNGKDLGGRSLMVNEARPGKTRRATSWSSVVSPWERTENFSHHLPHAGGPADTAGVATVDQISAGRARRGRMILLLADKVSISDIALTVGISRRFVYKWVRRFLAQGIEGLADKPGRGFRPGGLPTRSLHEEGDTYDDAHAQGA